MKSLMNIENGVRTLRVVLWAVVLSNLATVVFAFAYTSVFCSRQDDKIYALEGRTAIMMALGQNVKDNREAEAKAALNDFHQLFFAINPDTRQTEYNMSRALKMSDGSVAEKYQQLKAARYYDEIADAGMFVQYRCDSIDIDFTRYPYSAVVYGRTCINRQSGQTFRRLITSCEMRNVSRTENMPFGFLIEKFEIRDNSDIKDKGNTIYDEAR